MKGFFDNSMHGIMIHKTLQKYELEKDFVIVKIRIILFKISIYIKYIILS